MSSDVSAVHFRITANTSGGKQEKQVENTHRFTFLANNATCKVTQCSLSTDPSDCLITALYNVTENAVDVVIILQGLVVSSHLVRFNLLKPASNFTYHQV